MAKTKNAEPKSTENKLLTRDKAIQIVEVTVLLGIGQLLSADTDREKTLILKNMGKTIVNLFERTGNTQFASEEAKAS